MRSAILDSAVRPVVIVLIDPTSDRGSRFFQAPILRRPDFLLFQAAMEAFDVAVAFRVMIRRPPMVFLIFRSSAALVHDGRAVPLPAVIRGGLCWLPFRSLLQR